MALDSDEQDVFMTMIYREKKIRDMVNSFANMGPEQRREVFERLGLPVDIVSRIQVPSIAAGPDPDIEWVDWKGPGG